MKTEESYASNIRLDPCLAQDCPDCMSGLRSDDPESQILFTIVRGEGEQCPGSEAKTQRQLLGVRHPRTSAAQILPTTPTEQTA
jgi:hypothetical protein